MARSKFFRVATEGATTDGRTIKREWIEQAAANYDPKRYAARVNLEHLRGLYPDSVFRMYGDVVALEARDVEDGKRALFAQLDPTDDLVAMSKARQKVFTSIEIDPNFAGSGEAYMVGLAVTDSPASLGCEMLQFAAGAASNPLAARKQGPDNLFTEAVEFTLEIDDEKTPGLIDRMRQAFARGNGELERGLVECAEKVGAVAEVAEKSAGQVEQLASQVAELSARLESLQKAPATTDEPVADDETASNDETFTQTNARPVATGGNGSVVTDC